MWCSVLYCSPTLLCFLFFTSVLYYRGNVQSVFQDPVFDPVALGCGHVFCNSCVCGAASVLAYEGPRSADRNAKCPLCRKVRRYLRPARLFLAQYYLTCILTHGNIYFSATGSFDAISD